MEAVTAPQPVHVTHDGVYVASNEGTVDDLRRDLRIDEPAAEKKAEPKIEAKADPEGEKVKAGDAHKRISELTWKAAEAERREKDARDELAKSKAAKSEPDVEKKPTQAEWQRYKAMPDAPKEEDFESYTDFVDARSLFIADKRYDERRAKERDEQTTQQRQRAQQERHQTFHTRVQEAIAQDATIATVLSASEVEIPAEGPIPHVLMTSPVGVQMMRHLAEHPDEVQKIAALRTPMEQYGEMKKLEQRMEARAEAAQAGSAPPAKTSTKAEPPINPVAGSHVAVKGDGPPGDDASEAEHYAYWNNPKNRAKHGLK